jgi:hypothetical protein
MFCWRDFCSPSLRKKKTVESEYPSICQGKKMTPLQVAAQFTAFVWYRNSRKAPGSVLQQNAKRFAKENWQAFLPVAHEGLGRLLLRVAKASAMRRH